MTDRPAPQLIGHAQQRYYAERLIDDLSNIEAERNLTVNELDARTVARWLLLALPREGGRVIEAARRYVLGIDVNKAINEEEMRRLNQGQTVTMLVGGPAVDPLGELRAELDALAAGGETETPPERWPCGCPYGVAHGPGWADCPERTC